jgi:hypothetical protein
MRVVFRASAPKRVDLVGHEGRVHGDEERPQLLVRLHEVVRRQLLQGRARVPRVRVRARVRAGVRARRVRVRARRVRVRTRARMRRGRWR